MERNLRTVAQFAAESPFTAGQVRWWIFNAQNNGLSPAVLRVGRRVYLDTIAFERWLECQNVSQVAP